MGGVSPIRQGPARRRVHAPRPRLSIGLGLGLVLTLLALGRDTAGDALLPEPRRAARIEAALDQALDYLAAHQRADGAWPSGFGSNNGVNAFCLMAFLARGHEPGRGPYRDVVDSAVHYILTTQRDDGLYASPHSSHGPMYEHALATVAMIEAYGFLPEPEIHASVQKAVDLIVDSQNELGGWRYQPLPADADLTVTATQVLALRAAVNARLEVPQRTLDRALEYVQACALEDGGFSYMPGGGSSSLARAAMGTLSMQLLGAYDHPQIQRTLEWISQQSYSSEVQRFWYTSYYLMQAHYQAGGARWRQWSEHAGTYLLERQQTDGSWPGYTEEAHNTDARTYSTSLGALALAVHLHYLPMYQR